MPYPDTPSSQPARQDGGSVLPQRAEQTLREDAHTAMDTVRHEVDAVAEEARSAAGTLAEQARAQIGEVAHQAKGLAAEQKDLLAGQIGGVADAMQKVATELETQDASSASYARMIADGAGRLSETVRNNDVDQIIAMAQDFGRRQPGAFLGAAALLGFAASRFLIASAKREDERKAGTLDGPKVDYNGLPQTDTASSQRPMDDFASSGRIG